VIATARITSKGQVTIPKEIRERLGVEPGDALDFRIEDGRLDVRAVKRRRLSGFRGLFPVSNALDFAEERKRFRAARGKRLEDSDARSNLPPPLRFSSWKQMS
jgi:AbrB family looped-hinge helix DNA binding protein